MENKQIRDQFKLRLSGVAEGTYSFSIVCDDAFFELAEISDLQGGQLLLQIEMEKSEKMVDLQLHFSGEVQAPCDRCLLPVNLHLDFQNRLFVKLVPVVEDGENEDDDDIWVVDENIYELDIFHYAYESILLALPHRIVHEDDADGNSTCDPEVLRKLEELSAEHKQQNNEETDPRWDALKNLKLD